MPESGQQPSATPQGGGGPKAGGTPSQGVLNLLKVLHLHHLMKKMCILNLKLEKIINGQRI